MASFVPDEICLNAHKRPHNLISPLIFYWLLDNRSLFLYFESSQPVSSSLIDTLCLSPHQPITENHILFFLIGSCVDLLIPFKCKKLWSRWRSGGFATVTDDRKPLLTSKISLHNRYTSYFSIILWYTMQLLWDPKQTSNLFGSRLGITHWWQYAA